MREILVCEKCFVYVFLRSKTNRAPDWTGEPSDGDSPEKRQEIPRNDLLNFCRQHRRKAGHNLLVVQPAE